MKKKWLILISVFVALGTLYLLSTYTSRGRILSLYVFAAIKAPISTKIACAHETDTKVIEKFTQPLAFDEETKNQLREFWHFSYYRECLFRAGYDFFGNKVQPSVLSGTNQEKRYTNYFSNITFVVPKESAIFTDNMVNPDIDDYSITSQINFNGTILTITANRSHKNATSLQQIDTEVGGLTFGTNTVIQKDFHTNTQGIQVVRIAQDDNLLGFYAINPEKLLISVYGKNLSLEQFSKIENSFSFIK